jgi:hypothetical protein
MLPFFTLDTGWDSFSKCTIALYSDSIKLEKLFSFLVLVHTSTRCVIE